MRNVTKGGFVRRWSSRVCLLWIILSVFLPARIARAADYDFVVAQDGSGDFTTVQAAILAVPEHQTTRTRIFIKAGTYKEKITVPKSRQKVTLVGENRDTTVLAFDDHAAVNPDGSPLNTTDTPSFSVLAKDFAARNLSFANTAGDVSPAIALWTKGNRSHFRHCAFLGYQDTLFLTSKYTYFKSCYVEGAVDVIFGRSTAVFQGCTIHSLGYGYLTAANQDENARYGYVFRQCTIQGDGGPGSVFLGRPWGIYAKVVYTDCYMDDSILPAGWDDWGDPAAHDTVFFAEYNTSGPGADPAERVDWSHQLTADEDAEFSLANVFKLSTTAADGAATLVSAPPPWYDAY